jgi:hypothetical protein
MLDNFPNLVTIYTYFTLVSYMFMMYLFVCLSVCLFVCMYACFFFLFHRVMFMFPLVIQVNSNHCKIQLQLVQRFEGITKPHLKLYKTYINRRMATRSLIIFLAKFQHLEISKFKHIKDWSCLPKPVERRIDGAKFKICIIS